MEKYCCDYFKEKLTNDCEQHGLSCPDNVVQQFKNGDFGIPHPDDTSYIKIEYCPWCGNKLKKCKNQQD